MSRTFEGIVVNGEIRLLAGNLLPENTRVVVVVAGEEGAVSYVRSPRLAKSSDAIDFTKEVSELPDNAAL